MKFRYNPFDCPLSEILPSNLTKLYEVSEGWYVEYKSQAISVKAMAKSLSAFANQYGGWLVLGVDEDSVTHTAKFFPGIKEGEVPNILQTLREASKDILNPEVFYETREFKGPIDEIKLMIGRSIIVVKIPPGAETPYIHADGRVYRRVADSSAPKPETDRSTLDRLWDRAEKARARLESFVKRCPDKSEAEDNGTYLHLSILSDPYEVRGDFFSGNFHEFTRIMRENPIPCDNIFSRSGGFIARQTNDNDPSHRIFTWEFDLHCHSFVTLPINTFSQPYLDCLASYQLGTEYNRLLEDAHIKSARLVDLNIVVDALMAIGVRHRALAKHAGVNGPFYVKANLENVWRTVPFIDNPLFVKHAAEHGVPVVQDKNVLAPLGTELETFIQLLEEDTSPNEEEKQYLDAMIIAIPIFEALGVPRELLIWEEKAVTEMIMLGQKFKEAQRLRKTKRVKE